MNARRLLVGSLVGTLGLTGVACRLGDLVKSNPPGRLAVSPPDLADTAAAGTSQTRTKNVSITSDGGLGGAWRASVTQGSGWLQLSRTQDTVPATLGVTFKAAGLTAGTYRDTIQLTSADREDDVVRIPVLYMIRVPQRPPATPSGLGQFRIDGTTAIEVGGLTTERTVILQARVTDPDAGDSLRLEAEVQPIGIPFSNVPNTTGVAETSGNTASTTATGLSDYTSYHWQVRALDRSGLASAWVSFGGNGESEADFRAVLPPTRLVFLTQPSNTTARTPIAPPVRVVVQDAGGSTLTYFSGSITIAVSANPSDGSLEGTRTQPVENGIATFGDLQIDRAGTGYTLAASSPELPSVISASFDVAPGAAARLAFSTQPVTATAGSAITPSVRVTALDASGNVAAGFSESVSITIDQNPAGGTLSGVTTVNAAGGVATFSGLIIDRAGSGYTLRADASGLDAISSEAFDVVVGTASADRSTVRVTPDTIPASSGSATATITVTARDGSGNLLIGVPVTLSATGTGNTVTPASGTTNEQGVFTATISSTVAGSETISAAAGGVTITQTATLAVIPSTVSASQSSLTATPATLTASSGGSTALITVTARDALGNPIAGATVTVAATGTANTFTAATGSTNAGGGFTADFSSTMAETKTISATINGVTLAQTADVTVAAAAGSTLVFTQQPTTTAAGAAITPDVVVIARDEFGNRATSFTGEITIAIGTNPAGGTLSGTVNREASSGSALFGGLRIDNAGTGYTLTATATGLSPATSAAFDITP
ncbi:MAG: Ig-like domain-containing protein [Gemmatimonadetes bacterium]|nr:Ig-like domain-containing protein [Gemmatimonadota bacterium]